MPLLRLDEKVAVITGAGSGIGRGIALLFARQGARVVVLDLARNAAEATVASIQAEGGIASAMVGDVSQPAQVERAFAEVKARHQRLDILVNNAGIAHIGTVETTTDEDFDRLYAVNVKGVFLCMRAGLPAMLASGGGVILNLASIASLIGVEERFAYCMTKGAVLSMTRSVALDYVHRRIRCNCICPARIHTPFVDGYLARTYPGHEEEMFRRLAEYQPVGRMGTPEEVATLALYLCSEEASFITGQAFPIDGGVLMR